MQQDLFASSDRARAIDVLHSRTSIYTREPVVEQVLDHVGWPRVGNSLVDTSCGDGAFLVAAIRRLLDTSSSGTGHQSLANRVQGWEIHFQAVAEARGNVRDLLVSRGYRPDSARDLADAIVREGDFLTQCPASARFDTIVGNPPYLRWQYVPDLLRQEYEQAVPNHARADLLHSFLDRCSAHLNAGGTTALITADRWLTSESAARLREAIGKRLGVLLAQPLDAGSAFYRSKLRRAGTPPRVHPVMVVLKSRDSCSRSLSREPLYPCQDDEEAWANVTLGEVAAVSIAPWLGSAGVFVVPTQVAATAGLPPDSIVPVMDTDDTHQGLLSAPTRVAIRTSKIQRPPAVVEDFLRDRMHMMCPRGRMRPEWVPPERFDGTDLSKERLVVPRIAKTLKPIKVPPGVLPINHNIVIAATDGTTLSDIEAMLTDPRAQRWIERRARPLEGGYLSLTTKLLRKLPVASLAA